MLSFEASTPKSCGKLVFGCSYFGESEQPPTNIPKQTKANILLFRSIP